MPGKLLYFSFCFISPLALRLLLLHAQAGFDDDRVMLQGFYWESYRHGHPEKFPGYGSKTWYGIVTEQAPAIREARFDLIWLPPPSFAGRYSAGYNPKEYFNLNNSYGDFAEHRSMLTALLGNGIEPIADIVINHRDGSRAWADFRNPDWGLGQSHVMMRRSRIRLPKSSERQSIEEARRRSGRSSTPSMAGRLMSTARFGISTTRIHRCAAT